MSVLVFAISTICSPGAANLLAADSGARVGIRRSSGLLAGLGSTVLAIIALCATGVGALVAQVPAAQLLLRVGGSAYLLRLAWKIFRSHRPAAGAPERPLTFATGVVSTAVNPKTWTVGLGAAASFSGLAGDPLVLALVLTAIFAAVVIPDLVLWAWLGQHIGRWSVTDRRWHRYTAVLAALLLLSVATLWLG